MYQVWIKINNKWVAFAWQKSIEEAINIRDWAEYEGFPVYIRNQPAYAGSVRAVNRPAR